MSHWIILPVVLPLMSGLLLLLAPARALAYRRALALLVTGLLVPLALGLLALSWDGDYRVYALGNWVAPYGIVLVLDRLAALMLALTALLALPALWYASRGDDARGRHFHALFQFQLMGLNGAFLTGDLFNLFVFFEVLLIASYALLLHGGGSARSPAGLHYVLLNLAGSSLFLIAVGVLYGITGTLNMADLAQRVAVAGPADAGLLQAAGLLLLLVFALKAALLPLYFWLPAAYSAASAPVAALFAIMTKVGVYGILRVYSLIFGDQAGLLANLADAWLWPLALATLLLGAIGALAANGLRKLIGYLIILSVGTLLAGVALNTPATLGALLYYLLHTTLVSGGLFLLAGIIRQQRGPAEDRFIDAPAMAQNTRLGVLFFVAAIAVAGLPPLSGFLGKFLLLAAVPAGAQQAWLWSAVLVGGLVVVVALSRAGSRLFWKVDDSATPTSPADQQQLAATALLVLLAPLLLTLFAEPVLAFTHAVAEQMFDPRGYMAAVLGEQNLLPGIELPGATP
jgi:multicomponent K+:H+ antiporter subunit D